MFLTDNVTQTSWRNTLIMDHTAHLLRACEEGNISVVEGILDKGTDVNVSDDDDCTPLQVCCR